MEWLDIDTQCTIEAYQRSRKRLTTLDTSTYSESEKAHINAMIRDIDYAISWMEHARQPGRKRGIENLAAYQREISVDPHKMDYIHKRTETRYDTKAEVYAHTIQDAMDALSARERECYELAHGQLYSHSEIGMLLNLDRRNVATLIKRAEMKLKKCRIQLSLFHVG